MRRNLSRRTFVVGGTARRAKVIGTVGLAFALIASAIMALTDGNPADANGDTPADRLRTLELAYAAVDGPGNSVLSADRAPAIGPPTRPDRSRSSADKGLSGLAKPVPTARPTPPPAPLDAHLTHQASNGDTLLSVLESLGISAVDTLALIEASHRSQRLRALGDGDVLRASVRGGQLQQVSLSDRTAQRLVFRRVGTGFAVDHANSTLAFSYVPSSRWPRPTMRMAHEDAIEPSQRATPKTPAPSTITSIASVPRSRPATAPPLPIANTSPAATETRTIDPAPARVRRQPPSVQTITEADTSNGASARSVSLKVRKGDSLYGLFKANALSLSRLHQIVASDKKHKYLRRIRPGQQVEVQLDDRGDITKLIYSPTATKVVHFVRAAARDSFEAKVRTRDYERRIEAVSGRITNSVFAAAAKAGLPDTIAAQLVDIFGWDIDFAMDIRRGDRFHVLYERLYVDGRYQKAGKLLAASFTNNGETVQAVRYEVNGQADYFTPKGRRLRRAFIRTPVRFARISSRFSTRRRHPLLHTLRAHRGVDYAAPTGTPVRATGDGKVTFVGRKGGYGKTVIIQHGGAYTTLYAHLSRTASKLRRGQRVRQGQTIGYVGSTGLATGPHLHYEFRVRGVHRNPLTVPLPRAGGLPKRELARFRSMSKPILQRLASAARTKLARAGASTIN